MIYPVNPAMSAIAAFRKKMDVTSNNIANANTDGFKKSRTTFEEVSTGGVKANVQEVTTPGINKETIQNNRLIETESSNVDLAEELVEMISTQTAYGANLKSLKASNEMLGSLLDIFG